MERSSVQFTTSPDGAPIAYWNLGTGPPLVVIHNFTLSHGELEWEIGSMRSLFEALAREHRVVRLDPRGSGLSGPESMPSTETVEQDVLAVADALGLAEFDLVAVSTMAPVGIGLATTERVRRLALCDPTVTMAEAHRHRSFIQATDVLAKAQLTEPLTSIWGTLAPSADFDALHAVATANFGRHPELSSGWVWDGRPQLRDVAVPTLVLYTRDGPVTSVDQAREAAATIADARLVAVDGKFSPYFSDREAVLGAFGGFFGWSAPLQQSGTSIVVFTDIVASTEVIDRLGDDGARSVVHDVEELVEAATAGLSGRVVKHLGDGSLLEFQSASRALDFALRVDADLKDEAVSLRIGMAAGEPIRETGDLHGAVVVMASRINAAAGPGEVLVSDGVRQLVVGKGYRFEDRGEHSLKGLSEQVRLWRLLGSG